MKKIILLFIGIIAITIPAMAQAYESTIQYDKKKHTAIAIDYNYSPEAVQNAFVQKMEKLGYKAKEEKGILNKDKGFLVFKNAYVTDVSSDKMDYIVKVERKSRKSGDQAILYMIMNKGDENAMVKMDAYEIGNAKSFLNSMLPDVEAASLELDIKAQQETVAKAEKKLSDLKNDQISLEKKLAENKTGQENTQKDIEAQKQALGILMGKRRSN